MVLVADVLYIGEIFLSITNFFLSFTPGHLCISPVHSEQLICYVLLVIQLLSMSGFFPLCYGFFLCVMVYTVQQFECSLVLPADSLCIGGFFFPVCLWIFPVIHPGHVCISPVYSEQLMFFFSVSYKVAEDEWIFFLSVMDFFLCTIVFIRSVV